jgi:hypothetical protein
MIQVTNNKLPERKKAHYLRFEVLQAVSMNFKVMSEDSGHLGYDAVVIV